MKKLHVHTISKDRTIKFTQRTKQRTDITRVGFETTGPKGDVRIITFNDDNTALLRDSKGKLIHHIQHNQWRWEDSE